MSLEYPCIYYYGGGLCRYGGEDPANICVLCPCPYETPSNGDRIRTMSDEELAVFLDGLTCDCADCADKDGKNQNCEIRKIGEGRFCEPKDILSWLQQPAREDNNETGRC